MLVVEGLCIDARRSPIVKNVSFEVSAGERVGLLGSSGSGKSLTAAAIIGHLPPGITSSGVITVDGHDVAGIPTPRRHRDARPAMVFQQSATALNPMVTVGKQLNAPSRANKSDTAELLQQVGFTDPSRILASYPLELSGGQRQRVCIALAISCRSPLLVADEPTTALDVVTQARVLTALRSVDSALLFITHDVAVAAQLCTRLIVMDRGEIIERGSTSEVLENPRAELTKALIARAQATDPMANLPGSIAQ